MQRILVTGGSGLLGSGLIDTLLQQGYAVRGYNRSVPDNGPPKNKSAEYISGDIRDNAALRMAMQGCDTVIHSAALISFFRQKRKQHFEINVEGTKNVADSCLMLGVEKLIHVSTIAAIGFRPDREPVDESVPYNWGEKIAYRYTKHLAELEILKAVKYGLDATIVNPTVIIGPGDRYKHGGQLIIDLKLGKIPAYTDGGINIVPVNDVVQGIILAVKHGRSGERYIIGNTNFTHKDLFGTISKIVGAEPPKIKVPPWIVKFLAKGSEAVGKITGTEPRLTTDLAASILNYTWCKIDKARNELNFQPSDIEEAIKKAYAWYLEKGILKKETN